MGASLVSPMSAYRHIALRFADRTYGGNHDRLLRGPMGGVEGEGVNMMRIAFTDLLLFVCLALFLTGIMIAAASLLS